jgi:NAD(P)-dependent dehydrogenase (short-subunit alcohol dehydrogenase family)
VKIAGQIVVVTGGAQGIGRALCERFHREGAKAVIVADIDAAGAEAVAGSIGGVAMTCDVGSEPDVVRLVEETESRVGPIGLFCSNAGIARFDPDPTSATSATNADWSRSWAVNVMAHLYAARAVVPPMARRGGGYLLNTVSAAGLLSQIGGAAYATTKHAALGFAECLAITHYEQGIRVSVLCPQGVDTPMLHSLPGAAPTVDGVLSPEQVADTVIEGLDTEQFLILPHPQVATYMQRKTADYDRWLSGMRKLRRRLREPASH